MKAKEINERFRKKFSKLEKLRIDELGIDIYFKPVTLADAQALQTKFKDLVTDELTWNLEAVFNKSLDKDGNRIWVTDEDREFLRTSVPGSVITKIVVGMTGGGVEEAKKNS